MIGKVKQKFANVIAKEYELEVEKVMHSFSIPKEEFGDLATNIAFVIGKEKVSEIAGLLKKNKFVKEIKTMGPYVNIFLSDGFYSKALEEIKKKGTKYGKGEKNKKKIMVEFFHANTHKGVHIGHIRNISIGEALSRVLEFSGNNVIRANYQGDIGPHVAKCLWGFINLYKGKAPKENRGIWLGKVYSEASNKAKENEKIENEIKEINEKIYAKDKELTKVWKETRKWCLEDFEKFYKEFDVKFNELYFESETEEIGKKIVLELLKKGIVKKDQGAVIMDLKDEDLGVFVLLTKEGYSLYSTKDIGLAKIKFGKYKLDESIHVVGKEQEFYFKQLFKTFEKIGFENAAKASHHLIYELVMLPEGKMSSREGTMVLYEDLKKKILERTKEEVKKRHLDWTEKDIKDTAKKIGLAAIKFSMLKRECNKTLIFDWDEALNLEGDSGPYLQYAYVRTRGILKKGEKGKVSKKYKFNEDEKRVIKKMCEFSQVVEKSAEHKIIHNISEYLLELTSSFNKFYANCPVNKETGGTKENRLVIVEDCGIVIRNGLNLLGIESLERM